MYKAPSRRKKSKRKESVPKLDRKHFKNFINDFNRFATSSDLQESSFYFNPKYHSFIEKAEELVFNQHDGKYHFRKLGDLSKATTQNVD